MVQYHPAGHFSKGSLLNPQGSYLINDQCHGTNAKNCIVTSVFMPKLTDIFTVISYILKHNYDHYNKLPYISLLGSPSYATRYAPDVEKSHRGLV